MLVRLVLGVAALAASPACAAIYAETLLTRLARRHPDVTAIRLSVPAPGAPVEAAWGEAAAAGIPVPLKDALGRSIGEVAFGHRVGRPITSDPELAAELSRRIYGAATLQEPDPYAPGGQRLPRAQALVEEAIDANPDLVTLAMHVTPPGRAVNAIVASNFGRIGKAADADDLRVVMDGAVLKEVTDRGARLAVELPMLDAAGRRIGALSTSFTVPDGTDPSSLAGRAFAVRDALARATASLAALADSPPNIPRQHGVRLDR